MANAPLNYFKAPAVRSLYLTAQFCAVPAAGISKALFFALTANTAGIISLRCDSHSCFQRQTRKQASGTTIQNAVVTIFSGVIPALGYICGNTRFFTVLTLWSPIVQQRPLFINNHTPFIMTCASNIDRLSVWNCPTIHPFQGGSPTIGRWSGNKLVSIGCKWLQMATNGCISKYIAVTIWLVAAIFLNHLTISIPSGADWYSYYQAFIIRMLSR